MDAVKTPTGQERERERQLLVLDGRMPVRRWLRLISRRLNQTSYRRTGQYRYWRVD